MLTTLQQAKKLKELGFKEKVTAYYVDGSIDFNSPINWNTNEGLDEDDAPQDDDGYYSAPSVSEALDWFREVKGIVCAVTLSDKRRLYNIQWYDDNTGIDDHKSDFKILHLPYSLAESALLDDVMKYVEK